MGSNPTHISIMTTSQTATEVPVSSQPRMFKHGVILCLFCLGFGLLLAITDEITLDDIKARAMEDKQNSLSQVLPDELHDNNPVTDTIAMMNAEGKELTVFRARKNGKVTGVAYENFGSGYAGEMKLMIGMDADGKLLGVRDLAHKERPGLGDKTKADVPYLTNLRLDPFERTGWPENGTKSGSQEYFQVTPEMEGFGKAIAAGYSLSMICGRREIMNCGVHPSGTFNATPIAVAASLAALEELSKPGVYQHFEKLGTQLVDGVMKIGEKYNIATFAAANGSICQIQIGMNRPAEDFRDLLVNVDQAKYNQFFLKCTEYGVRVTSARGRLYLSTAHTEEDIEKTLEVFEKIFSEF